jgi:hypothetical protein
MKNFVLALFLCMAVSSAPSAVDARPKTGDFLIDPSKHYVYLKFDHVGDRKPLAPNETTKGLWLRLVNNCQIPITVAIFNTENAGPDHGVGIYDEVVPLGIKGLTVRFGGPAENRPKPTALSKEASPPPGYPLPDVFSTTTISPGESLLFNLPLNHVGPSWSLQIRFYLELPGDSYGTGPYSVVSFDWQDVPEKFREPGPVPVSPKPTTH